MAAPRALGGVHRGGGRTEEHDDAGVGRRQGCRHHLAGETRGCVPGDEQSGHHEARVGERVGWLLQQPVAGGLAEVGTPPDVGAEPAEGDRHRDERDGRQRDCCGDRERAGLHPQPARLEEGPRSVKAELVALDVLHHDVGLLEALGGRRRGHRWRRARPAGRVRPREWPAARRPRGRRRPARRGGPCSWWSCPRERVGRTVAGPPRSDRRTRRPSLARRAGVVELVPVGEPRRWRRNDVAEHLAPEAGDALGDLTVEGDLDLSYGCHHLTLATSEDIGSAHLPAARWSVWATSDRVSAGSMTSSISNTRAALSASACCAVGRGVLARRPARARPPASPPAPWPGASRTAPSRPIGPRCAWARRR